MQITDDVLYQHAAQAREIWLDALPQRDEIPNFSCSKQFQRKMDRLLRQQRRSPQVNRILHNMKRIAAVLLIAVTISFAGLMTVEASREKVMEVVVHIYHELTRYEYSSDAEAAALPEFQFDYLPEGMGLVSDETPFDHIRNICWEDGAGHYLNLNVAALSKDSAGTMIIDTENAQVTTCVMRGIEVTVVSKEGRNTLVWVDENVHYTTSGNVPLSELEAFFNGLSSQP